MHDTLSLQDRRPNRWCLLPILLTALTIFLCNFPSLSAQEMWVGLATNAARQYSTTSLPVFSVSSEACGLFETGWENSLALGGQLSFAPTSSGQLGLTGRIMFASSSGLLTTAAPEAFTFYGELGLDSGKVLKAEHEYRLKTTTLGFRLDLLLDYAVTDRLNLHIGPSLGYVLDMAVNQSDYITDAVYRFDGGAREQPLARQEILATQKLLIGGQAGISYQIPISANMIFAPEFLIKTDFTPLFQQAGRFMVGPGIGFALLTRIPGGLQDRDTVAADIPPPGIPAAPPFRASITLQGTDDLGRPQPWAQVRVYEVLRRNPETESWDVERRTPPPTLLIEPNITSPNGVSEWNVLFRYNGKVIGTSSSREDSPPTSIDWKILDYPKSDTGIPLVVELTVLDSTGATAAASDQVALRIERMSRLVDDRGDSILYTLYPVAEESPEELRENNRALREIAAHADERGKIEVRRLVNKHLAELSADSPEHREAEQEATAIAERLTKLLEEEEGKRVPISTRIQSIDSFESFSRTTTTTPATIGIVVYRRH